MISLEGRIKLQMLVTTRVIDYFLEDFEGGFVCSFSLAIALGIVQGGEAMLDFEFLTQVTNLLVLEWCPII